uniref:Epithelial discoidin domain-containing receptor 1 n=1 Tax=Schistocephalus solidus TaxID=70667 RepID=A0A0X3PBM1_SCHSO
MSAQIGIRGMLLFLCSFGWLLANCLVLTFGECKSNLLDKVPEAAFECSSSVSQRYGPSAARISSKDPTMQYRAWCPSKLVSMDEQEYLQVDLGRQHFIKLIITKGLSTEAKGGVYLTPNYYIWYRRGERGKPWIKYQNFNGTTRIKGNLDAQTERYVTMNPPFVARWVRIYPFNHEPVTVCLKLEIIGCDAGGIMEYQAPMGTLLPPGGSKFGDQSLLDTSYDNRENRTTMVRSALSGADGRASSALVSAIPAVQTLVGGLGKLTDGEPDSEYSADPLPSSAFVGWKRNGEEQSIFNGIASRQDYVRLVFFFDDLYNFTGLRILLANTLGAERALPRLIEARLGRQSRQDGAVDTATTLATAIEPLVGSAMAGSQWLHLDIARTQSTATGAGGAVDEEKAQSTLLSNFTSEYDTVARFVELRIYYGGPWIAIGEVSFMNAPFVQPPHLNLDAATPPEVKHLVEVESDDGSSNLPVRATPPLQTPPIQPHTYALVVGIGCLALLLLIMVLVMIAHWRRRSFTGRHKLEKLSLSLQQHTAAAKPLVKPEAGEKLKITPPSSGVKVNAGTSTQGISSMSSVGAVDLPFQWDYSNPIMHDPTNMRDAVFLRPGYTAGYLSGLPMLHPLIQTNPNSSIILPSCISTSRHMKVSDTQGEDSSADQYFQVAPDSGVYTTLPGSESESGNQVLDTLGMQPIYVQEGSTYVNTMSRTPNDLRLLSPLTHNQPQMYHIPPPLPPCFPLPPPPAHPPPSPVSSSTTCYAKPDWSRLTTRGNCVNTNCDKEFSQLQPSQEVTAAGTMGLTNTFSFRYSMPSNRNGVQMTPIFAGPGSTLNSLLDHGTTLWSPLHRRRDDNNHGQCYASQQQPQATSGMILSLDGGADLAAVAFPMSEYSSPTPVSSIIYGGFQGSPSLLPHLENSHSESPDTANAS